MIGLGNNDTQEVELLRARWERERRTLRLVDETDDEFATGGFAKMVRDFSARLVILPSDPAADSIGFDDEFWKWWTAPRPDPFGRGTTDFGFQHRPTAHAALTCDSSRGDGQWSRYLALTRAGALDAGVGTEVAVKTTRGHRIFRLLPLAGRAWILFERYADAVERFSIGGPFEVSLALRDVAGSFLGHLGQGWMDPLGDSFFPDELVPAVDQQVLLRFEVANWPPKDGARELALTLADHIENVWGMRERRYLARTGDHSGEFDSGKFR